MMADLPCKHHRLCKHWPLTHRRPLSRRRSADGSGMQAPLAPPLYVFESNKPDRTGRKFLKDIPKKQQLLGATAVSH